MWQCADDLPGPRHQLREGPHPACLARFDVVSATCGVVQVQCNALFFFRDSVSPLTLFVVPLLRSCVGMPFTSCGETIGSAVLVLAYALLHSNTHRPGQQLAGSRNDVTGCLSEIYLN